MYGSDKIGTGLFLTALRQEKCGMLVLKPQGPILVGDVLVS